MEEAAAAGFLFGLAFWPLLVILLEVLCLFAFVRSERADFAIASVIVTWAVLFFFFNVNLFGVFITKPWLAGIAGLAYVGLGVAYSFHRWDHFGRNWRREYDEAKEAKNEHEVKRLKSNPPRAYRNKNRIVNWMMFWPWSGAWFYFGQILERIYEMFLAIYRRLGKVYDSITARHTKGIEDLAE